MSANLEAVVSLNTSAFTSGLSSMGVLASQTGGALAAAFGGVTMEVLAMGRAFGVVGYLVGTLKQVVMAGSEFETEMNRLRASTDLSAADLQKMGAYAVELSTHMTATGKDIVAAMSIAAAETNGTADSIKGILTPALQLSALAGGDTKAMMESLARTMTNFGVETSSAAAVADLFARSVRPDKLGEFAEAMQAASKFAGPMGISMNETAAAIALFEEHGITGSAAGQQLGRVLDKLSDQAQTGSGKIGEALRTWKASSEGLEGAIKRLSDAGVTNDEILSVFGVRGGAAMLALKDAGVGALTAIEQKMASGKGLIEQYGDSTSGLEAKWQMFKNTISGHVIQVFDALKETILILANVFDGAMGSMESGLEAVRAGVGRFMNAWSNLSDSTKSIIELGVLIAGFGAFVLPAINAVLTFATVFATAMMSMGASFSSGFLIPFLAGMAVAALAFASFSFGEALREIKVGGNTIGGYVDELVQWLVTSFGQLKDELPLVMRGAMLSVKEAMLENFPDLCTSVAHGLAPLVQAFGDAKAAILEAFGKTELAQQVRDDTAKATDALRNFDAGVSLDQTRQQITDTNAALDSMRTEHAAELTAAFQQLGEEAKTNLEKGKDASQLFNEWMSKLKENGGTMWDTISAGGSAGLDLLKQGWAEANKLADSLGGASKGATDLKDALEATPKTPYEKAAADVKAFQQALKDGKPITDDMATAFVNGCAVMKDAAKDAEQTARSERMDTLAAYRSTSQAQKSAMREAYNQYKSDAREAGREVIGFNDYVVGNFQANPAKMSVIPGTVDPLAEKIVDAAGTTGTVSVDLTNADKLAALDTGQIDTLNTDAVAIKEGKIDIEGSIPDEITLNVDDFDSTVGELATESTLASILSTLESMEGVVWG